MCLTLFVRLGLCLQYLEATDEDLAEVIEKLKGNEDMQQTQ